VHFAGRLILAYNRMLYTYSKYLLARVAQAPEKPENFIEMAEKAVREPGSKTAYDLVECVKQYRDWGMDIKRICNTHIEYVEWGWRDGRPGMQEW
jgi:hypothetical protein